MVNRYFHTIRYLKPKQIFYRIWYKIYSPKIKDKPAPNARSLKGNFVTPIFKIRSFLGKNQFRLLNKERKIENPGDWNNKQWEALWLYNLHYFDDLSSIDSKNRLEEQKDLIKKWIAENPPGKGIGWDPYPTSLRIVNWIKWNLLHGGLDQNIIQSLAIQTRFLEKRLEYHILGNHLLANAKALIFSGCFFKGKESQKWLQKGLKVLETQLEEQVLPDGGHFERSPMYHNLILEDLLDVKNVLNAYDLGHELKLGKTINKMFLWSQAMRHPDGEIPFFNDSAMGIASSPKELEKYLKRLGIKKGEETDDFVELFPDSGYVKIDLGNMVFFGDVGEIGPDYLPGHAHADTLSFEISFNHNRILVNSGTSVYGTGEKRSYQRSTAAHNTLVINGLDSSEVWNGFRVARRARIIERDIEIREKEIKVSGTHNGYKRLRGVENHKREWLLQEGRIKILDRVTGMGIVNLEINFHFHPEFKVRKETDDEIRIINENEEIGLIKLPEGFETIIADSFYFPKFGAKERNQKLILVEKNASLPREIRTEIYFYG